MFAEIISKNTGYIFVSVSILKRLENIIKWKIYIIVKIDHFVINIKNYLIYNTFNLWKNKLQTIKYKSLLK